MRTIASFKNILSGVLFQLITTFLSFLNRSIFISLLGTYYLGINGVLLNVISLLSFAELGIGNAINYALYDPLAKKNYEKINVLMNFYKTAYRYIAIIVSIMGFLIFPFLKYFIDDYSSEISIIFFIFLLNNIMSYFLVYKKSILLADQKGYIINRISGIFKILLTFTQIIILIWLRNYYYYLISQLIVTFVENYYISKEADKLYPFLTMDSSKKMEEKEKKEIFLNIFSLFMYKISGVVINSTDGLVISYFIGSTILGFYSNYTLVFGTVTTFLSIIFNSLTASVGNLIVNGNQDEKYTIYKMIGLLNFLLYGTASICLLNLTELFLSIWIGDSFILSKSILIVLVINFYTAGMQNVNVIFREASGLFNISRYKPLIAAIINIISSVIFVKLIGLPGVLLGTVFSRLCTYFWHDPYIIHKYIFSKNLFSYFTDYIKYLIILLGTNYIINTIFIGINQKYFNQINLFIINTIVCILVTTIIFTLCLYRNNEFKSLIKRFLGLIKLRIKKSPIH